MQIFLCMSEKSTTLENPAPRKSGRDFSIVKRSFLKAKTAVIPTSVFLRYESVYLRYKKDWSNFVGL